MKYSVKNPPAYPNQFFDAEINGGLSLLDSFALKAPTQIPSWFNPVMDTRPVVLPNINSKFKTNEEQEWLTVFDDSDGTWYKQDDWEEEDRIIVPESFKQIAEQYNKEVDATIKAATDWDAALKIQTIIQWPYYYANLMLDHRLKILTNEQTENNPGE